MASLPHELSMGVGCPWVHMSFPEAAHRETLRVFNGNHPRGARGFLRS